MSTRSKRSRGMPRRSASPPPKRSRTPLLVGAALVGVVVVAAVAALALTSSPRGGTSEPASDPIRITGDALPALTPDAADQATGLAIPALAGTDLTGDPITIGPDDGPMAIVILAHWCPHCQAEVPRLVDHLAATGMPDGVRLVALSTSINRAQPNYPPSAWLEREGWTVPTMTDDASSSALRALGMSNFPGFVFVDADGRVASRMTGELPMETFAAAVDAIAP